MPSSLFVKIVDCYDRVVSFLRSIQAHANGNKKALPKGFVFVEKSAEIDMSNPVPEGLENHFSNSDDGEKLGNWGRLEEPLIDVSLTDR